MDQSDPAAQSGHEFLGFVGNVECLSDRGDVHKNSFNGGGAERRDNGRRAHSRRYDTRDFLSNSAHIAYGLCKYDIGTLCGEQLFVEFE
jgi:hypothetical protein